MMLSGYSADLRFQCMEGGTMSPATAPAPEGRIVKALTDDGLDSNDLYALVEQTTTAITVAECGRV
jgi:hypothetical protein